MKVTGDPIGSEVRRAVVLSNCVRAWGMPLARTKATNDAQTFEVYKFEDPDHGINRFATIGLSEVQREGRALPSFELFIVLPMDNGGADDSVVVNFLLDVAVYALRPDVDFDVGYTVPSTELAPAAWAPRALLIDEPRAEPEYLDEMEFDGRKIHYLWVIPVHGEERDLIKTEGLDAFDSLAEKAEWSLADVRRPSFV